MLLGWNSFQFLCGELFRSSSDGLRFLCRMGMKKSSPGRYVSEKEECELGIHNLQESYFLT